MVRPESNIVSASGTKVIPLDTEWRLCGTPAHTVTTPAELHEGLQWMPACVPGTVAEAVGPDDLDSHPSYDALDWWYRTSFPFETDGRRVYLRMDGLASLAEVWLNGELLCESHTMFCPVREDVTSLVVARNELAIRFLSLERALSERKPRPRWKTRLVDMQRLRWFRTTLMGRIPGWTPTIEPVGPWKPVFLEVVTGLEVRDLSCLPTWDGSKGTLEVSFDVFGGDPEADDLNVRMEVGDSSFDLIGEANNRGWHVSKALTLDEVEPWWPHTHGEPRLYPTRLVLNTSDSSEVADLGKIGFRSVELDNGDGQVGLKINGEPVFCRGACWTISDPVRLVGDPPLMRRTLELAAGANANMVRVGGTMVYETDAFYEMCDELGLMVWQDFMFANMDYPSEDEHFTTLVTREVEHQIRRLSYHPSVVTFCGSSETEQQAAMFGAPSSTWKNALFESVIPAAVKRLAPDTPYWPSTPTGGALPFHVGEGLGHYYGVGAYKRPLSDARLAQVKFSPECLGFSHVPESGNLDRLPPHGRVPHSPAWKRGVPRDSGAGWDFEDIRDHYLQEIFGVNPVELRSRDLNRYLELSRVVTGVVISAVYDEWRSPAHSCRGALVWFLKDLRPGAGWGLIDSDNTPKPVYWYLRRAWSPVRVTLLDRGVDGIRLEIHNEHAHPIEGVLTVALYGASGRQTVRASVDVVLDARSSMARALEELTGFFVDANYVYQFGPPSHEVVWACLDLSSGDRHTSTFWSTSSQYRDAQVNARWTTPNEIEVRADRPARAVRLEVDAASLGDNYLDVIPQVDSVVSLPQSHSPAPAGFVSSMSMRSERRIERSPE